MRKSFCPVRRQSTTDDFRIQSFSPSHSSEATQGMCVSLKLQLHSEWDPCWQTRWRRQGDVCLGSGDDPLVEPTTRQGPWTWGKSDWCESPRTTPRSTTSFLCSSSNPSSRPHAWKLLFKNFPKYIGLIVGNKIIWALSVQFNVTSPAYSSCVHHPKSNLPSPCIWPPSPFLPPPSPFSSGDHHKVICVHESLFPSFVHLLLLVLCPTSVKSYGSQLFRARFV